MEYLQCNFDTDSQVIKFKRPIQSDGHKPEHESEVELENEEEQKRNADLFRSVLEVCKEMDMILIFQQCQRVLLLVF